MKKDAYARAGVDVVRVKDIHRSIAASLAATFSSRKGRFGAPLMGIGHYAGLIDIGGGNALAMHTDSVGTKLQLAIQMEKFDTVGIDCVAMTVNDLICVGAEPVALLDYIALEREDELLVSGLMKGLVTGAREASTAIVGGETAILGTMVKGFDLVSMGVGLVDKTKVVDGSSIGEGDCVIGVASSGLHSNGYTLARSVLQANHSLKEHIDELGSTLGEAMLTPTRIYVRPVLEILRRGDVHGIGHITGGSFRKLKRLVGERKLEFALEIPPAPPIFQMIQREGGLTDTEMFGTFNMGIGLCICAPPAGADAIIRTFKRRGFSASRIGAVKRGSGVTVGSLRVAN
ncbi:MAG: phosphoribosylformylglycinamidine cyclo-ligase [Thaumarchaeota archaeon]|nr:phosphoribosylformylglycinamidine cyclo-ligase [Nitrososphaerota archaeon]